jgi:hypothetical protein
VLHGQIGQRGGLRVAGGLQGGQLRMRRLQLRQGGGVERRQGRVSRLQLAVLIGEQMQGCCQPAHVALRLSTGVATGSNLWMLTHDPRGGLHIFRS